MFVHDPLSSSDYPMIIYTHPIADNLPIKTLIARQLQTNHIKCVPVLHTHIHCWLFYIWSMIVALSVAFVVAFTCRPISKTRWITKQDSVPLLSRTTTYTTWGRTVLRTCTFVFVYDVLLLAWLYCVAFHTSGSRSLQNLVAISPKYYWPVLVTKAGCKGDNGKNGYSIQGLVAKVKDTVSNG